MTKYFVLIGCVLIGLLVLACGAHTNRNESAPSTTAPAGTPVTTTNRNDNTGGPATTDKVGIAECDNFIAAYESCVSSKVPEAGRTALKASVATWRTEWKKLADNPQTRGTLAAHCKTQRETTMAAMKAYNCTW